MASPEQALSKGWPFSETTWAKRNKFRRNCPLQMVEKEGREVRVVVVRTILML